MVERIGILQQPRLPQSAPLAAEIMSWLAERGVDTWTDAPVDDDPPNGPMADTSLLIVLGGDGSTLRAARWAVPYGVPLLGVNIGRVGFLSEATPDNWPDKLGRILHDDYWIERRLLLHAELLRPGTTIEPFVALNEVVIGRGAQARVIRLNLWVDGDLITTYIADALVVSTPTGSTAYALAAGGPLMPPQLQNFLIVPVAAHLSLNRPLVLHEDARISVKLEMGEAYLTSDGQRSIQIERDDEIVITKHKLPCCFARIESAGYFYRRLMGRLGFSWPHV